MNCCRIIGNPLKRRDRRTLTVYLLENRNKIIDILRRNRKENWKTNEKHNAIWMGSSVPLWGAAGIALAEFSRIIEKDLAEDSNEKGSLSVVLGNL